MEGKVSEKLENEEFPYQLGKYIVQRQLGQGSEGSVYLAWDETLHRQVAVKKVQVRHTCRNLDLPKMSMPEADHLMQLKHPMLPAVYDLIRDGAWHLVMEYIQGVTLYDYIREKGYVGEEQALDWADQLLDVVEYLHTRKPPVIYRDLKPQNIMVCTDAQLRLIDFGAACRRGFGMEAHDAMAVTPGYGAPEQFGRRRDFEQAEGIGVQESDSLAGWVHGHMGSGAYADERSDIYAIGKVLYYMVTGADPAKPPYASLPVRDYQPMLREGMEKMIRRCIRENPKERYQIVDEIRRDLHRYGKSRGRFGHRSFIRIIEKRVWLTEM